jgi:hypothetical protein
MCIFNKLSNLFEINRLKVLIKYGNPDYNYIDPITADYYNGSNDDIINIFIELVKHSDKPINVFNRVEYSERIKFLANEGLHILDINGVKPKSFKLTKDEVDAIITKKKKITKKQVKTNLKKAVANYKKKVKSDI